MMKRYILLTFLALCLSSTLAFALPTVTFDGIKSDALIYSGFPAPDIYAGELLFTINDNAGEILTNFSDGDTIVTFCVEANEGLGLGNTYDATLSSSAISGGYGGASGSPLVDPLSAETAWLYNDYLMNEAPTYDKQVAFDYQVAIWWLEDEILTAYDGSGTAVAKGTLSSDIEDLIDNAIAGAVSPLAANIQIVRLFDDGDNRQDILLSIPTGGVPVIPAPGALFLGSIGVSLVGWLREKKSL